MDRKARREKIQKLLNDSSITEDIKKFMEEASKETGRSVEEIAEVGRVVSLVAFIKRENLEGVPIPSIYEKFCDYIVRDIPLSEFIDILTKAVNDELLKLEKNRRLSLTKEGEMVASLHESLA